MVSDSDAKKIARFVIRMWREEVMMDSEECMDAEEAAAYLHITKRSFYNRVRDIPHTKIGKRLVFTKSALNRYIHGITN